MEIEKLQELCRALPGTTEDLKWGHNLVFSVGDKMFALISYDEDPPGIAFKTAPSMFEALTHQDGIIPAPYSARFNWVTLLYPDVLPEDELTDLIEESYRLVFQGLSKKAQSQIAAERPESVDAP